FVQIGQFLTWGDKCSSAISHNSTGHQDLLAIRNRTTLHPYPVLKTSGKGIDLGVILFGEDPPRLPCATTALVTPQYLPDSASLKVSGRHCENM
ncbi:MAG TPA: hypothetical protein VJ784_10205, partial [Pyrinomonadaceae bacterium]|nr:hypothetical protein [Pyrinomonadaceae bacterium]